MEPEITTRPSVPTAVVRETVSMDRITEFYDRAFAGVADLLGRRGVTPGEAFGRYLSPPGFTMSVEVGFTVPEPVEPEGDIVASELPGGRVATMTHLGPYDGLSAAWDRFGGWIGEQGLTPGPDLWEVYVTEPTAETDPATLRTDLFWALEPGGPEGS